MKSVHRDNIKAEPVPPVPAGPAWLADFPSPAPKSSPQPDAEPVSEQGVCTDSVEDLPTAVIQTLLDARTDFPVLVEDLPALVTQAFAEAGVEVEVALHREPADIPVDDWEEGIPVQADDFCPDCGSLKSWFDFSGKQHCPRCEPPARSDRLARKARRLRLKADRRHGLLDADAT